MSSDKLLRFIAEFLGKRGKIPSDNNEFLNYRYLEAGHIDSFGVIQLIRTIEDEFGIELEQTDLESELIKTVQGLVKLIETKFKEKL